MVVNHKEGVAKDYDFKINSTLQASQIVCSKTTELPSDVNRQFDVKTYTQMLDTS
jgi:hypothetical protein